MAATTTLSTAGSTFPLQGGGIWNRIKHRLSAFFSDIGEHQVLMLTGSIAYTTALSLAPFVLIILAIASLLGQDFQNQIYSQLTGLLGEPAGNAIALVVENADERPGLSTASGILGFLILVVSASAIFSQLRSSLDIVNETPPSEKRAGLMGFLRDKIFSVGLVLGFIFLLIASLTVSTVIASFFAGRDETIWSLASLAVNLIVFTGLFTVMFRYLPSQALSWRNCAVAAACATVFFLLGKWAIGLYLGNVAVGSAYGAAGTIVVFLVWTYYTALTLLVSYEFTRHMLLDSERMRRYT